MTLHPHLGLRQGSKLPLFCLRRDATYLFACNFYESSVIRSTQNVRDALKSILIFESGLLVGEAEYFVLCKEYHDLTGRFTM